MKNVALVVSLFSCFSIFPQYYNVIYISGDGFRSMADHIFDERRTMADGAAVQFADIVFVNADILADFLHAGSWMMW